VGPPYPGLAPWAMRRRAYGARVGGLLRVVAAAERLDLLGFPRPGAGKLPPYFPVVHGGVGSTKSIKSGTP